MVNEENCTCVYEFNEKRVPAFVRDRACPLHGDE